MKRIIVIALVLSFLFLLCACSSSQSDPEVVPSQETTEEDNYAEASPAETVQVSENDEATGIETDEKLLTVEILLPAYVFADEDMTNFDTDAYTAEMGLLSAEMNDDGSVTATMTKARHKELLEELAAQLDADFDAHISETSYITDITRNSDFSQITVKVIRADYENAFDFTHLTVGFPAMIYQSFLDMEPHVEVHFIDEATGEEVYFCILPDVMSEW